MGFYTVLFRVNKLIEQRGWRLNHCRRCDCGDLRYYVKNKEGRVLTPVTEARKGLTLAQLLQWLAHQENGELAAFVNSQTADPELAA